MKKKKKKYTTDNVDQNKSLEYFLQKKFLLFSTSIN